MAWGPAYPLAVTATSVFSHGRIIEQAKSVGTGLRKRCTQGRALATFWASSKVWDDDVNKKGDIIL